MIEKIHHENNIYIDTDNLSRTTFAEKGGKEKLKNCKSWMNYKIT